MTDDYGKTTYSYRAADGVLNGMTFPDGTRLDYALAASGTTPVDRMTFSYASNSLLEKLSFGKGLSTSYQFNGYDLSGITISQGTSAVQQFAYEYDGNKNITSRTQNGETDQYTYDELSRIQTETGTQKETYTYDPNGNRYSIGSGKIYGLKDAQYTYDSQNRLIKATGEGKTVTYSYNGDGLLYERTEGDQTIRYYYDEEAKLMAEASVTSGKAELTYAYIYDLYGQLWARQDKQTGKLEYYQFNGHGDVVGLVDDAGQVLNQYTYDIWGGPSTTEQTVPNILRYAGEYWDETIGLQYLRARWYDPGMGRFIGEDTYEGELNDPLSLNLYSYVNNNPLKYVDPSGHMPKNLLNGFLKDFLNGRNDGTKYTDLQLSDAVLNANGDNRIYLAFHEIAQIHTAKAIHLKTGLSTTLEYHIEQEIAWWPNKHYWVDIVTSNGQMWELKARRDVPYGDTDGYYEDAEEQLTKYQSVNGKLVRGAQYRTIKGIIVEGDLYMDIEFFDKGKIFYEFYLDYGNGKTVSMTTRQAENYVDANHLYPPEFNFKTKKGEGSLTTKLISSFLLILLQMGCNMANESNFVYEATYVVEVLEASIENKGFPKSEIVRIDNFFDMDLFREEENRIQEKLMSVYMAFLGKTNFKNIDSDENNKLFKQLIMELNEIYVELESM